jgi:uncharacterized protein (TIGR03435 family)
MSCDTWKSVLVMGAAVFVSAGLVAVGQNGGEDTLEVATVRLRPPGDVCESVWSKSGIGSFSAQCVKLPFLLHMAFGFEEGQIRGQEKWMNAETFDIVAKPSGHISLTREQLKPVLQQLLSERFHLRTHVGSEAVKGYALVVSKHGARMQPTKGDKPPGYRVYVGPGRIEGLNWSMSFLASMLQVPAGRPVVDKTGLHGSYDITLQFAPTLEEESSLPSLFTALRDSLGLDLHRETVTVPVLLVDHADKIPTEN